MSKDTNHPVREEDAEPVGPRVEPAAAAEAARPVLHRVSLGDHPNALQEFLESLPGPVTIKSIGGKPVGKG